MENKIVIHLPDETLEDIENLVKYKKYKDIVLLSEETDYSIEEFVVGCVNHYLKILKDQEDLSGIKELSKPFSLKNNFKEYAERRNMKQKQMSELTGIRPSNLSQIMSNKAQPSLDYFLRIWITLGCPPLNKVLYREEES